MTQLKAPQKPVPDWERVRDEWVRDATALVADVEAWCRAQDWPTRRINKRIEENKLGEYVVPALLFQVDLVKLMLEPAARFGTGSDGVFGLYVMPEYDFGARVTRRDGVWCIKHIVTGDDVSPEHRAGDPPILAEDRIEPFDAESFTRVVRGLI